jgi:hypothetical protein
MAGQKVPKWLSQLGGFGTFIATVITLLTTNVVLVVSTILAIVAALWTNAAWFFQLPAVHIGAGVFLTILWTGIGVTALVDRRKAHRVRLERDYSYGLTFEGITPNIDLLNDETWFSVGLQLRNYSQAPIQYRVTEFDIRIGTRALPKPDKVLTGYLARGSGKTISPSKFSKDEMREFFGRRMKGSAEIKVIYGHPQENPERQLKLRCDLTVHFPGGDGPHYPFAWGADIVGEDDEPYDNN